MANINWGGAAAGFGKGLAEVGEQRGKEAHDTKMFDMETARSQMLERMRQEHANQLSDRQHGQQLDRDEKQHGYRTEENTQTSELRQGENEQEAGLLRETQRQADERKFAHESQQNDLDRRSAEEVAGIRWGPGSAGRAGRPVDRFKINVSMHPLTGAPTANIVDLETNTALVQSGERLEIPGFDYSTVDKRPSEEAMALLRKHPGDETVIKFFLNRYKFLPSWALQSMPNSRVRDAN